MPATRTLSRSLSVPSTRYRRASSSSGTNPYPARSRLPSDSSTSSPAPSASGVTNPSSFAGSSTARPMSPTSSDVTMTSSSETIVPVTEFPTFSGPESDGFEVDVPDFRGMKRNAETAAGVATIIQEKIIGPHETDDDFKQVLKQFREISKNSGLPSCGWSLIPFPWDDNAPMTLQNLSTLYAEAFVFSWTSTRLAEGGVLDPDVAIGLTRDLNAHIAQLRYNCEDADRASPDLTLGEVPTPDPDSLNLNGEEITLTDREVYTYLFLEDLKLYFTQAAESLGRLTLAE